MIRVGQSSLADESGAREGSPAFPDQLLLARIAARDRAAFDALYARFSRPLFSYLVHLLGQPELAEDVLQEVLVIVWQQAPSFRGTGTAASWVFGIAHHQAFRALRRGSRVTFVELAAALDLRDNAPEPEAALLGRVTQEELAAALQQLTPAHREVLELAFFQDFSGQEIAAIVGIPIGTVKSRLSYARRALRTALLRAGWEG